MTEPMAAADDCEHHYESRLLGGHPLIVPACIFCRKPDWADLREQADELYRWGWQEGRAGKPARERLSAYDKPQSESEDGRAWAASPTPPPQDGLSGAQGGRERPAAGAEPPEGPEGAQAATGSREKTIREHTLNLHVIGEQLSQIESWFWQHLADARESARTTANNPATSGDAANNPLREHIAAALYERERPPRDPHWPDAYAMDREVFEAMADTVLPVIARETAQLRRERDMALTAATEARGVVDQVRAALSSFDGRGVLGIGCTNLDIPTAGEVIDTVHAALKPKGQQP